MAAAGPSHLVGWAAMFQLKSRIKYSPPGIAAAKLFSSGPAKNPEVFLDIEADGEPLGRIIIEVASLLTSQLALAAAEHLGDTCRTR